MGEAPADFMEFAHACSGQLFRTACLLTGDWHLAEDLVQETLAKMYRSWRRIDRTEAPVAYAHTVLTRTFISQRRLRRSGERPTGELPEPVGHLEDPALRIALLGALAQLSVKDRTVLVLRYWEDRSAEETAQLTGMSVGSVRVRSLRARERLRQVLGHDFAELSRA
ncbi:RNA polymerase sigma-70 factor (sigma-E family) [Kitasatospora gansuensis]|uniref:RNA polymerase sigma-70 factor (Sigma-E family) n=1 Tax=Kitasatospora gansuensis TaxID=258050 RepID=A0A7W7SJZ7_9ACTN|nr:SigE family RNA polymerase sigma factor [Kitasatospora gansuensis]MBB4951752.1 RNA polymerase sigma-70 factor (sigma-E family) [Kitasatospora gansuensis]